ncbi:cilia- and flagella-associated protein 100 isoform X1 [Lingula anatina]|uniref:Cilia- and flagella-associated protein 100 isoform X1 n=1 Tax=Lingula anatina TaxID=7574 RepID=A0A1S3H9G8_LINAN|nr:cilia- and flagella-associated protein 100 isoform X1 [Lingula anatina]|eukprot:XP_013381774.1 cilia- and flagella-associated protein 100 isoform X1 [Lingula anatina]
MGDSREGSPGGSQVSGRRSGSGQVALPTSAKTVSSQHTFATDDIAPKNPFTMPQDNDIFMLRDKERQRKKQERIKNRNKKVHEKTTYASRVNFRTAQMIRPADSDEEKEEDSDKALAVKEDPQFVLAVTKDRHVEKESLADYISKKREMFLVQYSLGVKRDEMRKLEEIAHAEERKLEMAEQYLEEDAAMFDEFLKENDKNSVDAIRAAEAETKAKIEKVQEIKRITAQMMGIRSEISKYEELLKEYQLYKGFLESLTPNVWLDERKKVQDERREQKKKEKEKNEQNRKLVSTPSESSRGTGAKDARKLSKFGKTKELRRTPSQATQDSKSVAAATQAVEEEEETDEEPELYFSDSQQLLDIFAELEEQNLSLIQNSQETEEALEEMKQNIKSTKRKMEKETSVLKEQIDKLNTAIGKEETKAKDLEMKARMFNFGDFNQEDQERMLAELNQKVEHVYRACIGDNEANISTLQMLTNIENRLEELFEQIEMMPQDKVEAAEKSKEKERRLKQREEKMEQQRLHQEERVRRALERAKAEPKKKLGRKLVERSEPPRLKKKEDDSALLASKEEEELAYFFT